MLKKEELLISFNCESCGSALGYFMSASDSSLDIKIVPCQACLDQARDDGHSDGYETGKADGFSEGLAEAGK